MRFIVLSVAATALLMAGAAASAPPSPSQHYRWKDASGVIHYSDTIPSSALAGGYDIVNNQGMLVRHVGRESTPAERTAIAAASAKAAAANRARRQQSVRDAQLLSTYPTDTALKASQHAQLKHIQTGITALQTNLHSQEDSLTALLGHAADLKRADKPVPAYLNQRIAKQRDTVNAERHALARRNADLARTKSRFAAQLAHYRKLRSEHGNDGNPQ